MLAQVVLFDDFDLLDAVAPYEVLAMAGMASGGRLSIELVSAEGARRVPSAPTGVTLDAAGTIDLQRATMLIVPGVAGVVSGDGPDTIPARLGRAMETSLPAILREALATPDLTVATVCGGTLLLGLSGLLQGRPAVTHHLGMELLEATGATPIAARVVDDGNVISAGGVTSGLDLGLYLVERTLGPRIAHAVEAMFEYERRGTVWCARGLEPVAL
jgi:transcriptional regulator GlxA family with amidase domain